MNIQNKYIDAFWCTNNFNKSYLSQFSGSTSEIIITDSKKFFITDGRYKSQVKEEVSQDYKIEFAIDQISYIEKIIEICRREKIKSLGFESNYVSVDMYDKIKEKLIDVELIPITLYIDDMRLIKTDKEIKKIKKAIKITDITFKESLNYIKEGMTEKELKQIIDNLHLKNGGDYPSFETIVAFGENSAKPHSNSGDRKLRIGDVILIDFGIFKEGYCSDMTRTFIFKKSVNKELEKIFKIVYEAMNLQIESVKPGIKCSDIDMLGRKYISEKGYGDFFLHGTGHGIGREIHESPRIIASNHQKLEKGMVFTIEPGIYLEEIGGVRLENDILVTDNGYEILNKSEIFMVLEDECINILK